MGDSHRHLPRTSEWFSELKISSSQSCGLGFHDECLAKAFAVYEEDYIHGDLVQEYVVHPR